MISIIHTQAHLLVILLFSLICSENVTDIVIICHIEVTDASSIVWNRCSTGS